MDSARGRDPEMIENVPKMIRNRWIVVHQNSLFYILTVIFFGVATLDTPFAAPVQRSEYQRLRVASKVA